jgi:hypothetical protein
MYHELVHCIHERLERKGVKLPDTQDQEILEVGQPDASTPEHQELVRQNFIDCLPYLDVAFSEPLK